MTIYCLFPVGSDSSAWLTTFERRASANLTNLKPVSNNAASLLDHSQATDLKSLWGTGSLQEYGCALSLSLSLCFDWAGNQSNMAVKMWDEVKSTLWSEKPANSKDTYSFMCELKAVSRPGAKGPCCKVAGNEQFYHHFMGIHNYTWTMTVQTIFIVHLHLCPSLHQSF